MSDVRRKILEGLKEEKHRISEGVIKGTAELIRTTARKVGRIELEKTTLDDGVYRNIYFGLNFGIEFDDREWDQVMGVINGRSKKEIVEWDRKRYLFELEDGLGTESGKGLRVTALHGNKHEYVLNISDLLKVFRI